MSGQAWPCGEAARIVGLGAQGIDPMGAGLGAVRERKSHIWDRHGHDWYQEPIWVSQRLFDVEGFEGPIFDPCCGGGGKYPAFRKASWS
jgi:hypothetical protein